MAILARKPTAQVIAYVGRLLRFDDPLLRDSGSVQFGAIPAGGLILMARLIVPIGFVCIRDGQTLPDTAYPICQVGTTPGGSDVISQKVPDAARYDVGVPPPQVWASNGDQNLFVRLQTPLRSSLTAGQGFIVIEYVPHALLAAG